MAPISTQWTRLIRFVAAETAQIHIRTTVGLAAWNKQTIRAYEISGSAFDPASRVTSNILTVEKLLSPLSREEMKVVRCLGLNYSGPRKTKMAKPAAPILFYKPLASMIGPNAPIFIPKVAQPVEEHLSDYEVELTIDALDYVLGYTGANDVSFRKHQLTTSQWGFSKGFDNTTPLGPVLVSHSAISNPQEIPLTCTLNGQVLQDGNTNDQIFNVRQTVSFLSQGTTLEPGSVILTGTPKGVGFARKPAIVLKNGDDCRVWLGHGIGTLINPVIEEGHHQAKL
ncbi:hypothetical protein EV424DRAFT_1434374 [Suillus variegatus]|nr:hypothetical protein EV424DRAFT_1434374 [Suillus variegatus]